MVKKSILIIILGILLVCGAFFAYIKMIEIQETETFHEKIIVCGHREKPRCFAVINDDVSYCNNNTATVDKCQSDYYWYKALSKNEPALCNSIPLQEKKETCELTASEDIDCSRFEYDSFGYDAPPNVQQDMCRSIKNLDESVCYDMQEPAATHCLFLTLFFKTLKNKDLEAAKEHYVAWKRLENTTVSIEAYVTKDPLDCIPRSCILAAAEIMSSDGELRTGDKETFSNLEDCDYIRNQKIKEICRDSFY